MSSTSGGPRPLDAEAIARAVVELGGAPRAIHVLASTPSTNDEARAAAKAGDASGALFVAEEQTKGRGRGDHAWHSPRGENLYFSWLGRPPLAASLVAPLALVAGVVVARLVASRVPDRAGDVRVKWPNDVLVDGRKLAGVLVESQLRGAGVASVVVGVGLNVATTEFPAELAGRATSLALLGASTFDRNELAAALSVGLERAVDVYAATGLTTFQADLARFDALLGRAITIGDRAGVAAGIDDEGRLLVRDLAGTIHPCVVGEVAT